MRGGRQSEPPQYRELPAPDPLRPWVSFLFERVADGTTLRLLPDGSTDVVWIDGRGGFVYGASSRALVITFPAGTRLLGARLRPGAGPALLGIDGAAIRDAAVPLDDVWGDTGRLRSAGWQQTVTAGQLAGALMKRTARSEPDRLVAAAIERLRAGEPSIARLADTLGISERQLRRRFHAAVGLSPKRLARILRLQRALTAPPRERDLTTTALDAGFADHSHFVNECRALSGLSPGSLLA